ncbi:TPA: hypothetical protein ACSP2Q_000075 [Aeromonas veronii]
MSFDIYGNQLRRGYCEVHPHVHEEYPCSVCVAEKQRGNSHRVGADYDPLLEISDLQAKCAELKVALESLVGDIDALIKESGGVYGLHQNGDPAPWGELVAGGRHETWLLSLSDAAELIAKLKAGAA